MVTITKTLDITCGGTKVARPLLPSHKHTRSNSTPGVRFSCSLHGIAAICGTRDNHCSSSSAHSDADHTRYDWDANADPGPRSHARAVGAGAQRERRHHHERERAGTVRGRMRGGNRRGFRSSTRSGEAERGVFFFSFRIMPSGEQADVCEL